MTSIQQALEQLKVNPNYQVLVAELRSIQSSLDKNIRDESITDAKRKDLVVRTNTIQMFIELPDDIINIEKLKEASNTDSSEG
jgi:hypothetical protein